MATPTHLSDILSSFTTATSSTLSGLPTIDSLLPPENGITLLDAKNEIFLSYLQGLAVRNLNIIRSLREGDSVEDAKSLNDRITRKLVEQRVYLERGVRPLEGKIRYQVERVIKAAEDEERAKKVREQRAHGKAKKNEAERESASDEDSEDEDEDEDDEVLARPNAASLNRNSQKDPSADRRAKSKEDGVYRPPRVTATTMPTSSSQPTTKERRQPRSRTLDEYITSELSAAPIAEPSIGSTIAAGGRRDKDARQLAREKERQDYEETNLMRLPKEAKSKRDRQKEGGGFGGEEWRDLGGVADRIGEVTRRKGGRDGALERSRKRKDIDGQRGDGIGDAFERKRRRVMKKRR